MPIYYKKIDHDNNDLNLMESGLGSSGNSFLNNLSSVPKKLSNISGSRASVSEVELEKISSSFQTTFQSNGENNEDDIDEEFDKSRLLSKTNDNDRDRLMTKWGPVVVVRQSPIASQSQSSSTASTIDETFKSNVTNVNNNQQPIRPVIITYHDIGLNYFSNFESFFTRSYVKIMLQNFRIYHINAPGQEENAENLSSNYIFPTMDDLSDQLAEICRYYKIEQFIGFGYGAGSNVLSRFALHRPDMVEGLFLINPSATTSTWTEWFYQKFNLRALAQPTPAASVSNIQSGSLVPNPDLPISVQDYFIWHLFGNLNQPDRVIDNEAVTFYKRYFSSGVINKQNLSKFIESYVNRTALAISRDDRITNIKCPVAIICADYSPHIDESVKMNSRLDPINCTWVKLSDCSMPLEEQPNKLAEVLRLFLQGLGYTLKKSLKQYCLLSGKSMPCLQFTPINQSIPFNGTNGNGTSSDTNKVLEEQKV